MVDAVKPPVAPMSPLLKVGLAAALFGITAGVLVAVLRIQDAGGLFEVPGYSTPMLAPMLLGALAVILAVTDMVQRERYRRPARVFALGLAAIATPFLFAFVIGACLVVVVLIVLTNLT